MSLTGQDFYRIGSGFLKEGNLPEALHYLRLAENEMSGDYEVHIALGRALAANGEQQEAADYYRRNIEAEPDRAEAYLEWSDLFRQQGLKEEANKMVSLARTQAGYTPREATKEISSWEAEASAPKPEQIAFYCPRCEHPILHGTEEMACSKCRHNLIPLRHGHIRMNWRLDGTHDYQCAQCNRFIEGTEFVCPHCATNLTTGVLPDEPQLEEMKPKPTRFKNRKWAITAGIGLLLVCLAVGQIRTPQTRREVQRGWGVLSQRMKAAPEPPPKVEDDRPHEMDTSVEASEQLPKEFVEFAGMILIGGLILALGVLKLALDR